MLERTMASLLMAARSRLHHCAVNLMVLLRWVLLPSLWPWDVSRQGTAPCTARTSSVPFSARRVKNGLRTATFAEVSRSRQGVCCGGSGGGGGEGEICAVCLGNIRLRDMVRVPRNCHHVYHRRCLDRWIEHDAQGTCPLCRAPLLPPAASSPTSATASHEQEQRGSWAVEQLLYLFGDDLLPPNPSSLAAARPSSFHFTH